MQEQLNEFGDIPMELLEEQKNEFNGIEAMDIEEQKFPFVKPATIQRRIATAAFKKISIPSPKPKAMSPGEAVSPDETGLVEICFIPSRNGLTLKETDDVSIVSEFTQWKLIQLTPEKRGVELVFTGKFPLQPGFKYKFRFMVNGSPINDKGYPDTKNTLGQAYNYIVVPGDFDLPMVKQRSYLDPAVESELRKEGIQKYFKVATESLKPKTNEKPFSGDLKSHVNRLLYKHSAPEGFYKLLKWNKKDKEATVRRLCDNNKIPLDTTKYTKQEYFFLNELNDQFFFVGSKEEESTALHLLNGNKLKVKYKIRKDLTGPHPASYCETVSVDPENIPIQDVFFFHE